MEDRVVSNVLENNTTFISRHLVLSPTVINKLWENGVITDSVKRQLEFKDTDDQVPFLINSFKNGGLLTFKRFLAVMRETGHGWIVDKLLKTQALSMNELNSYQGLTDHSGLQDNGLYGDRSVVSRDILRLEGLTPEHAKMRLTSAGLRGRYGTDRLQDQDIGYSSNYVPGRDRLGLNSSQMSRLDEYKRQYQGIPRLPLHNLSTDDEFRRSSFTPNRDALYGNLMDGSRDVSKLYRDQMPSRSLTSSYSKDYSRSRTGNVPDALLDLHEHYREQGDTNEQTLTVLKREEMALKDLVEQNAREQIRVRQNQSALSDIGRRLEEINTRTHDVQDPISQSHLSRHRLLQLNQIPWSSQRPSY